MPVWRTQTSTTASLMRRRRRRGVVAAGAVAAGVVAAGAVAQRERQAVARSVLDQHGHEVTHRAGELRVGEPDCGLDDLGMKLGKVLLQP